MDQQLLETLRVISLPTKTNFRGISIREVALFKGPHGWGEFSPFLEYGDAEAAQWLASAVEAATTPPPQLFRTSVAVNGTIPALNDPAQLKRVVDSFPGVKSFKVKVGNDPAEDLARVNTIRELKPQAKIRIDINGLWSVQQAEEFLNSVGEIEYVEQPCATIEELRELKSKTSVKIVGDEILRKAVDPFDLDLTGAVDYLMLKVQPLGGIKRAHALAEHHKLPVVVSSALESAIGINYGLTLAASFPELKFDCGLGTGSLLVHDVATLPIVDGRIQLTEFEPVLDGLDVSAERFDWWKNRIMRTAELLK
ncbi:MAG: o-succinylbenzoate synthase [Actinomycetales bacterium]|nr:o-succinylbenzoate synthase [Actinomycetales bacterium]